MRRIPSGLVVVVTVVAAGFAGMAVAQQDKYTVQVPGGLALSECRRYEDWPVVAVSHPEDPAKLNLIVANSTMIEAYRAGIPGNGKRFPDGSKMMKILWEPKQNEESPFAVKVPDALAGIGCMVKDSKRFADTGGWGWGKFDYDTASEELRPNTSL